MMTGPGDRPGMFAPNEPVTRAQLATVLYRIAGPQSLGSNNPTPKLSDARNAQRRSDVNTILNAIYQYTIDNNGQYPFHLAPNVEREICQTDAKNCSGFVDLSALLESYLVRVPQDPLLGGGTTTNSTWYSLKIETFDTYKRLTVTATHAEDDAKISVTR